MSDDDLDKAIDLIGNLGNGPKETDFTTTITAMTVHRRGSRILDETATEVKLDDEGCGAFVVVEQANDHSEGKIQITPEEWPELRRAIDAMLEIAGKMK